MAMLESMRKSLAIWAACAMVASGAALAQGPDGTGAKGTRHGTGHGYTHRNDRPAPVNMPTRFGKPDIVPPDRAPDWTPPAQGAAVGGAKATGGK
ncbi:hypothetical protein [Cupriavidus campinensis]